MKHKNKIQIAGLGLALALSQAVSAYAAGTVVVGKAPGETAAETTAAEATTESTVTAAPGSTTKAAPENTTTATTKAAPAVLDTPAHVVTARSLQQFDSGTAAIYCGSRQHAVNGFHGRYQTAGGCGRGRCTVKRGNR